LHSFISGNVEAVDPALLRYFDVTERGEVSWIMHHLFQLLNKLRESVSLSSDMRAYAQLLYDLLHQFKESKNESGDNFEAMFVFVFLIHAMTGRLHSFLMPGFTTAQVSYNDCINPSSKKDLDTVQTFEELDAIVAAPPSYPHISIYWPKHDRFELYDLIVYFYPSARTRTVKKGFQLRRGKKMPERAQSKITSVLVRGQAAQQKTLLRGWDMASEEELASFFGISGARWLPKKLLELTQELKASNAEDLSKVEDPSKVENKRKRKASNAEDLSKVASSKVKSLGPSPAASKVETKLKEKQSGKRSSTTKSWN